MKGGEKSSPRSGAASDETGEISKTGGIVHEVGDGEGRRVDEADEARWEGGGEVAAPDDDESALLSELHSGSASALDDSTAVAGTARLRVTAPVGQGTVLAQRYQIEAQLGEGGSGIVYRAWDRILGELIAIKLLHPERAREKSWIRRLAREVKVARAIRHPNVCRVFELGHADDLWFVTMELATGGSLRDMLAAAPTVPRPLTDRLRDIRELCAGLGAMHAVAITHRDVTPRNVLRMADGRLVLTDFGLAIERDDQTTVHGGTPAYMPPEAARGERSDQRSDVFQLGMIMHEVLTGVRPTWTPDGARLKLIEPAPGASVVEEELAQLVADCVKPDPALRPPSAVAVAGRLAAAEAARPAPLPIRVVTRLRRTMRLHPRLMAVAAGVVLLGGVVRTVQILSRPPLCTGAALQLEGIWDPARAAAVRRAFVAAGKSYAVDTFARVQPILDDYAGAWKRMYTDACEATHLRGEQSAEVLDLRMTCLKTEQGELRALTDLFSSADGEAVSRSITAASGLSPVSRCADVVVLKAVVRPPDNRDTQARVEVLRQGLAEIKAMEGAGRYAAGVRRAIPLVADARAIGYEPLLAEALDTLGRVLRWSGPFPEAEARLDEAMLVAEASRHDRVLAEAAIDKASLLGSLGRVDDLDRLMPRAEATLKRIGGDSRLEGWMYAAIATALVMKGRFAASLAFQEKALAAKQRVLAPDEWDVALSMGNIASCLHSLGRNTEALAQNERAIAILERALGRHHPDLALHIYNRGEIQLALGHTEAARADFVRSLAIWKDELSPDHIYNSYALTGLGLTLLAEGQAVASAIEPLERARRIREAAPAPPEFRAETSFALARALWLAGADPQRDRPRAIRLAESARDLIPPDKSAARREIEASLALWQLPERKSTARRGRTPPAVAL